MSHYGMPGPGGSMYGHDNCLEKFSKPDTQWTDLPQASPLRIAFEQASERSST